jgi:hypothetical protein
MFGNQRDAEVKMVVADATTSLICATIGKCPCSILNANLLSFHLGAFQDFLKQKSPIIPTGLFFDAGNRLRFSA